MKEKTTLEKIFDINWFKKHDTKELRFISIKIRRQQKVSFRYNYKGELYDFDINCELYEYLEFVEQYYAETDEEREAYSLMYKHLREILKQHPMLKIPFTVGMKFGVGDDKEHHPFRITNFEFYEKMKDRSFIEKLALDVLQTIDETKKEFEGKRKIRFSRDIYFYGKSGKILTEELSKIESDILSIEDKDHELITFMVLKGDWAKIDGFTAALYKKLRNQGIGVAFGSDLLQFSYK